MTDPVAAQVPDQVSVGKASANPAAVVTSGVGSLPGTDSAEVARIVAGEFDVPFLAELPGRGPGADMLGRTLALISGATGEFAGETTPNGWRLAGGRSGGDLGRQMRRGQSWLREDADHLEDAVQGFAGAVKVQVAGPWTLAAGVETSRGTRLLADAGACADLSAALAEAVAEHVGAMRRRVPGAAIEVVVDEPTLPVVLAGGLRTASGRGAVRVPEVPEVEAGLRVVLEAARGADAGQVGVHCCAGSVPFEVFARAGANLISVDLLLLGSTADEALGRWWDRGGTVALGVLPSMDPPAPARGVRPTDHGEVVARTVDALWNRIGFGAEVVAARTRLTPTCGLAGASPAWARGAGAHLRRAAHLLNDAD